MKKIKLNDGEYLSADDGGLYGILKHRNIPEYKILYYALPSENCGIILESHQYYRRKSIRRAYHNLDGIQIIRYHTDKDEAFSAVLKEQKRIETLLRNKGVGDVLCLFWNDAFVYHCEPEWIGEVQCYMLGVE